MLLDRTAEREALGRLLEGARAGRSGVLVVRGEPGVGKTALLEDAVASAAGLRIARAAGVESEMELPYAALQQLCAPMLDRLEQLPGPQRDALGVAFGLRAGGAPDRFLVGLATLSLLAEVAAEQPLLCVIDDAHWLDRASAQTLVFVARRLLAEPVAVLVATREPDGEFSKLPELLLEGLSDRSARELLGSVITGALDERVRERILAETRGNPLALLELPRALTAAELAGGFGVPDTAGLPKRIEDSFRRRYEALPPAAERLVLVAAAEPTGDPALLCRAAERLGFGVDTAAAAAEAGLLTIGDRVTFRHPLVRSAVYRAASLRERRMVHNALADATDPRADPDRRAWHRAQAAPAPDEEVAAELEASASRAQARGGLAAAAAFLERSSALTIDPGRRAERALAAAKAKYQAGAFDAALGLVSTAESGPLEEIQRAQACLLRAQIAFASNHGSDAPPLMLKAARKFERLDQRMARDTYLEALLAALFAGGLASGASAQEVAKAALAASPSRRPARAPDLLLDGLALLVTEGYPEAAPVLKRAVSAFRDSDLPAEEALRCLWLGTAAARLLWDYEGWEALSCRLIRAARDVGALIALDLAFGSHAMVHLFGGEYAKAASLVVEVDAVTEATGSGLAPYAALTQAALRGKEREAEELIEAGMKDVQRRGEGGGLNFTHWATAVLYNGLGRYEQALTAAQQASQGSPALPFAGWGLVELVEAASRSGSPEQAAAALRRLSQSTQASGSDWAVGVEARSRALISDDEDAEALYLEAIDRLGRTRLRVELGRAHLLYGEWLRRQRRRRDAREQLSQAFEIFDSACAAAFAERARIELRASGGHARKRTAETLEALTPQEALIAHLAGTGASNPQIAEQLFISPATVAYHLRKVFAKLGISSRGELTDLFPAPPDGAEPDAAEMSPGRPPRAAKSNRGAAARPAGYQLTGRDHQPRRPRTHTQPV
jgi:DNA-binding CsgD family transcriptional regulator